MTILFLLTQKRAAAFTAALLVLYCHVHFDVVFDLLRFLLDMVCFRQVHKTSVNVVFPRRSDVSMSDHLYQGLLLNSCVGTECRKTVSSRVGGDMGDVPLIIS